MGSMASVIPSFKTASLKLEFAKTEHSTKNLAIKINEDEKSLCYSGDGDLTENTIKLYSNCDLLVHDVDAFSIGLPNLLSPLAT